MEALSLLAKWEDGERPHCLSNSPNEGAGQRAGRGGACAFHQSLATNICQATVWSPDGLRGSQ